LGTIKSVRIHKVKCSIGHACETGRNIVGPQIRRLRFERNLSQPAFAAKCQGLGWDVGRDTVAKIEAGSRWVGDFELVYLARALGVSLLTLFPQQIQKTLSAD
jgi:transcriptional regulator with XRE-family HTH domain